MMRSGHFGELVDGFRQGHIQAAVALGRTIQQKLKRQSRFAGTGLAFEQVQAVGGQPTSHDSVEPGTASSDAVCDHLRHVLHGTEFNTRTV